MVLAMVMVIPGEVRTLISFLSFSSWLFTGFVCVSLVVCRIRHPDIPRPYRVSILLLGYAYVLLFFILLLWLLLSDFDGFPDSAYFTKEINRK